MAFGRLGAAGTGFGRLGSSGSGGVAAAVGGGALLTGEVNGFATDFTYATDAQRVAVKTAGSVAAYAINDFYQNAGTSAKMVYDSAGVLGWSPHNLVEQSKDASTNVAVTGITITANVTAGPLGDATADQIALAGGNGSLFYKAASVVALAGVTYCGSVWMKAAAPVTIGFRVTPGDGSGTHGVVLANVTTAWQQFSAYCTTTNTATINVGLDHRTFVSGDDGLAKTVIAADWQINRGTTPTAYLPTTTTARFGLAIDCDPVTHAARGLLCEPAGTNLITHSNNLPNMSAEGGTVTGDNQTGPDGTATADTFTEDTATITHNCYAQVFGFTASADYTISRYIKMGTRRYVTIGFSDGTNGAYGVYDLQSGVVGSSAALGTGTRNSASIQALLNGWYRCVLSGRAPTTAPYVAFGTANAATIAPDGFGRQSFLGTGATLFFGHAQVEAGTVATSPIPTTAASVTRAADKYNCTPASIGYSATAGSWWTEMYALGGAGNEFIIGTNSGTVHPLFYNSGGHQIADGTTLFIVPGPAIVNNINKVISAFTTGSRAITYNGLAPATDAGTVTGLLSSTYLGFGSNIGASSPMLGYIRKLRYLPRRPSNAELQTMTA